MSIQSQTKDLLKHSLRNNLFFKEKVKQIKQYDSLSEESIKEIAERKANKIVRYSFNNSNLFRKFCVQKDFNPSIDAYNKIPITYKSLLKGREKDNLTSRIGIEKAYTSGTSGSPLTVYRSYSSIVTENAYVWFYRNSHGVKNGDPIISLRGNLDNNSLHYYNKAENILYLSSYLLSKDSIELYYNLIKAFNPKAILAYPSSIYNLVNLLENRNFKLAVPIIFTSSETVYQFQRSKIECYLSGRIYDWYGNAERTIALGECYYGNYHELPLYSYNEYLPNGIITTSLINTAFPLIRYFVDDIVEATNESCQCGKTFTIKKIEGRIDDVVILKGGQLIGRLDVAFKGIHNILYSQIVQDDFDHLDVKIVPGKLFSYSDQSKLEVNLRNRLDNHIKIDFKIIDESDIIKSPSGKYKLVISHLPAPVVI